MSVAASRIWANLTTVEITNLDFHHTIAVLPFAAVEQHGPHLPLSTDSTIAEGFLRLLAVQCPDDLKIVILPLQAIGVSGEHTAFAGTLSLDPAVALEAWSGIIEGVIAAGIVKLVLVSAHGGNAEVLALLARQARCRHAVVCVVTAWQRFGLPDGLYTDAEALHGIHAGDVETSLMLHFAPALVRQDLAADFPSTDAALARRFKHLRATGRHGLAWMTQDLNASGAVGNAAAASAEKGRLTAQHQVTGFIELLHEVAAFALEDASASLLRDA